MKSTAITEVSYTMTSSMLH